MAEAETEGEAETKTDIITETIMETGTDKILQEAMETETWRQRHGNKDSDRNRDIARELETVLAEGRGRDRNLRQRH